MSANTTSIFGEVPAGVDLSDDSASKDKEAIITLTVIAAVAVALRFYARSIQRQRPHYDDWVITICLMFLCGAGTTAILGGKAGIGRHVWALTIKQLENSFKSVFIYLMMYGGAVSTSKISILLFYQRVFVTDNRIFRVSVAFGYFICISYFVSMCIATSTACRPLSHFWTQFAGTSGSCVDTDLFFYLMGILNMVNDIYVLIIPIPQILALKMSLKKKLAVLGIMLLGVFVCAASCVRIYYLTKLVKTVDITGALGPLFIWSVVEPAMAIVSASLPHLLPLRQVVGMKLRAHFSSKKSSADSGVNTRAWKGATGASGALYTYGGSRFNAGRDKLVRDEDEIELTTRVEAHAGKMSTHCSNSGDDISTGHVSNNGQIVVKSSIVQKSTEFK